MILDGADEGVSFRTVHAEAAERLAGHVVAGEVADELVLAGLEVGGDRTRGAGREVLALGHVRVLVEQPTRRLRRRRGDRQAVGGGAGVDLSINSSNRRLKY